MKLFERLRIQRELLAEARVLRAAGKSEDEVAADLSEIAKAKYDAVDWGKLLELILTIVALLFSKKPSDG